MKLKDCTDSLAIDQHSLHCLIWDQFNLKFPMNIKLYCQLYSRLTNPLYETTYSRIWMPIRNQIYSQLQD